MLFHKDHNQFLSQRSLKINSTCFSQNKYNKCLSKVMKLRRKLRINNNNNNNKLKLNKATTMTANAVHFSKMLPKSIRASIYACMCAVARKHMSNCIMFMPCKSHFNIVATLNAYIGVCVCMCVLLVVVVIVVVVEDRRSQDQQPAVTEERGGSNFIIRA